MRLIRCGIIHPVIPVLCGDDQGIERSRVVKTKGVGALVRQFEGTGSRRVTEGRLAVVQTHPTEHQAPTLILNLESVELTDKQFYRLCRDNPDLRFELTAQRELIIMSPTGSKTGWRNGKILQRLANWSDVDGSGICFDSSTGFTLPNGAKRSPDAAWVRRQVWESLTDEQQDEFAPICPEFLIELLSSKDSLTDLRQKMQEYIENGTRLGWLIDPGTRRVYIYRPGQPVECLETPATLSGDPVLPGFTFDPAEIW
jgi:Uma2 family endonuclease